MTLTLKIAHVDRPCRPIAHVYLHHLLDLAAGHSFPRNHLQGLKMLLLVVANVHHGVVLLGLPLLGLPLLGLPLLGLALHHQDGVVAVLGVVVIPNDVVVKKIKIFSLKIYRCVGGLINVQAYSIVIQNTIYQNILLWKMLNTIFQ